MRADGAVLTSPLLSRGVAGIQVRAPAKGRERALVVVGTPTIGLVGAITANHLVLSLGMEPVGHVETASFAPVVLVKEGLSRSPVQVHVAPAECKVGVACSRIVVVSSELTPPDEVLQPFADALVSWAKARHAPMLLVPDGMEKDADARIDLAGVASDQEGLAFLDAVGVPRLREGLVAGLSACLLIAGAREGLPVVALLGETEPEQPDARAAAAIVGVLAKVLPGLPLDTAPLLAQAEEIEKAVRGTRARAEDGETMFG